MDTENEEETPDPEEDFMTKLQNHIPDLIPDLMRNAGIAGLELSTNNYVKAASSVLHLAGDLYKSANDRKTRKELEDVTEREKRVSEREKLCEENEQRIFAREERNFEKENRLHQMEERIIERERRSEENEKRLFDREKILKEILKTVKTTKRARADETDDTPPAKRYDPEERITCHCGSEIRRSDLSRHHRTIKHHNYQEENNSN